MTMPALVYILCFVTCAVCAGLLVRTWWRTRTRLLLWTAVSFVFLAINNFLLISDVLLLPDIDLIAMRYAAALAAGGTLIIGLIWESE